MQGRPHRARQGDERCRPGDAQLPARHTRMHRPPGSAVQGRLDRDGAGRGAGRQRLQRKQPGAHHSGAAEVRLDREVLETRHRPDQQSRAGLLENYLNHKR